jgi:uncharacterized protein (DUF1501 family)
MCTHHDPSGRCTGPEIVSKRPRPSRHLPRGVTRRDILRFTAAGAGLAALGPVGRGLLREAHGAPNGQPFLVIVNDLGGHDGLNIVIPSNLTEYYTRRFMDPVTGLPTGPVSIAIPPAQQLSLAGGPSNPGVNTYTLHPALVNVQAMWNAGDVAIIHRVGYPDDNLSHFTSEDIFSTGVRDDFATLGIERSGWIARYADQFAPTPLGAVSVGVGRRLDFIGGTSNPLQVSSLAGFQYQADGAWRNNHTYRLEVIRDMLEGFSGTAIEGEIADALAQGHALADQIQAAVASYSSSVLYQDGTGSVRTLHRTLRDIAMLRQYGFETQVFYTGHGGHDLHANQGGATGSFATLFHYFDTAVEAFRQDMVAMGSWDQTVILLITEFGRRNFQNGSGGTDHGHESVVLAIGGAVNGGYHGPEETSADLLKDWMGQGNTDVDHGVDFRDVYRSILTGHLGADLGTVDATVFPEPQPKSTSLTLV